MINKNIWFSSDWHLDHKNIIKFDKRPFNSIEEMNESIIVNYNKLVNYDDDFYFLGDFCFSSNKSKIENFLSRLTGNLHFIKGNHDHRDIIKLYEKYGQYLGELKEITVNTGDVIEQKIVLCHYAMKVWNKSHRGSWHLYGHSHHSLPDDNNSLSFDVGCNGWDYKPLNLMDVKKVMNKKTFKPIDHHE